MLGANAIARARPSAPARLGLSGASLALATAGLAAADWGSSRAGSSVIPGGPLDETAHVLTTLLVLWALGPRTSERYMVPALVASVAIDLDHVPAELGANFLTAGTPRPYTHSLLTIAVVLAGALAWRRRRDVLLGVAIGLSLHLWRDTSESGNGVSLWWPFSYRSVNAPHAGYLAAMGCIVAIDAHRLWKRRS
ncbi:MAG: metal-dependent hydrolase [Solirubrobacteraceae bacterium]